MAIVVETGAIIAGANSYISRADATTYHAAMNNTAWATLTTAQMDGALLYAAQWLDGRYMWPGTPVSDDQTMSWPRMGAYDSELRRIASSTIPQPVKDAQCEFALAHASVALNTPADRGGAVDYAKVDDIAVSFADGAPSGRTYDYIDRIIRKVAYPFSRGVVTVV